MLPKLIHNYSQFSPTYTPSCSRQQIRRPHLQTSHLNAIMSDSSWNTSYTCSAASSSFEQVDSTSMFPTINSRQAHESYPSPASSIPSPSRAAQQDTIVSQEQTLSNAQDNQTSDCYSSSYVDSNVDHDNRILSGRLSRLEYRGQRRRDGIQSPYPRTSSALSPRHYSSTYDTSASRPQSPACSRDDQYNMNVASAVPIMMQNQSYRPLTPSSLTPNPLMSYSFDHPYPSHSQVTTTSHTYDHRPPSPALSTASSRSDFGHHDTPEGSRESPDRDVLVSPTRPKPKKAKLTNALRKEICIYQQQHPHQKQEEIAQRFGVERSTVSKILKEKKTWLNIEDGIAEPPRHRPPKHPKLEEEMLIWLEQLSDIGETITDAKIQKKALEIADDLRKKHGTIGSEKSKDKDESFKASAGWIENFKRRHHVKGGVWHGRPKAGEPEIEDAPMTSQEPEILHAMPEQQYIHHSPSDLSHHHHHHHHHMEIEAHPGDIVTVEDLPKGVPSKDEAERAYHILTHYLDSNVQNLEDLGYKPEHRQALHEMFHHVFFKTSAPSSQA